MKKSRKQPEFRDFFQRNCEHFLTLSVSRGANSIQWIVAEKNIHACLLYEKFVKKYCGHKIGIRHYGQMAYDGEVSNVFLYELTKEEYFDWKLQNKKSFVER